MQPANQPTGILLVNLGTPDSPSARDVRRYLREFLSDPRVLTMPRLARWLLLNLVILPTRPKRSAEAYAQIWLPEGSPLLVHSRALAARLAERLGASAHVELAMRYGSPDITSALDRFEQAGVRQLLVVPLFPQYSEAATGSALARVRACLAERPRGLEACEIRDFHSAPGFIQALASSARPRLEEFQPDHVLLSYHGLPESQLRRPGDQSSICLNRDDCCEALVEANRDCYRAQCFATSRALAGALSLAPDGFTTSFQSRLGRARWIQPYTDEVIETLAARGVRRLAVLCPAFVADCLETLEEIGIRLRAQWLSLGGSELELCPCPNADPAWVEGLAAIIGGALGSGGATGPAWRLRPGRARRR